MDRKRLQELRAEHRPWREGASICVRSGCQGWPCEQSQILDLALTCFDPEFGVAKVVELKDEAERLRADWGAALDTMSFLRDDLTKARTEVERLEEKWKAFDSLRVEAMNKADAWREEAERLRAALTSVRAQLERAMNTSNSDLSKFALVREIDSALAGTEAKS
jgi:multidrug resistance efflux pump